MGNQEKNKAVSFENLRMLGSILSGNELSGIVSGIAKSRNALDVFCKKLKEHEVQLKKQKVVEKAPEEILSNKTVKQEEPSVKTQNKTDNVKPINKNIQFNKVSKDNKSRDNFTDRGERPNNRENKTFEKKPFVPRDNNGYKPKPTKPEVIDVVSKPERSFGNKNKTKTFDTEKKELSKKAKIKMGYIDIDDNYLDEERMGRIRTTFRSSFSRPCR